MSARIRAALTLLVGLLATLVAPTALAFEPFTVKDIRVEGVQRTDAGTVFNYLPIKVGDRVDDEKASAAVKALYATGFFRDVRLEVENGILVVIVQERPTISQLDITGAKEFDKDTLRKGLKDIGVAESRIFDRSALDRAEQEIKRQYINRGYYAMKVTTTVTPQERNRVAVNFTVDEGDVAKIAHINIVGAQAFPEATLIKEMQLSTSGWFTWYTKNDQYSKQKLAADLETLRSYYTNRGYLQFQVDSTEVSITPEKENIYITINITEGPKYTIGDVRLAGELLLPEAELMRLILVKPGDVYSREKLTQSAKTISDRLGSDGYAFANVNAVPDIDREKLTAAFTFFIDPGRRIYIRRINISGNAKTRDEVIRREMRQLEDAWYDATRIERSKVRITRLNYFEDVNIETPAVAGSPDQVDIDVTVTEKATGNLLAGVGYSSADGLVLTGSVSQNNVFGTGNSITAGVNTSKIGRTISVLYSEPYWTEDGITRTTEIYDRSVNSSSLPIAQYSSTTLGAAMGFAVPVTETDCDQLRRALRAHQSFARWQQPADLHHLRRGFRFHHQRLHSHQRLGARHARQRAISHQRPVAERVGGMGYAAGQPAILQGQLSGAVVYAAAGEHRLDAARRLGLWRRARRQAAAVLQGVLWRWRGFRTRLRDGIARPAGQPGQHDRRQAQDHRQLGVVLSHAGSEDPGPIGSPVGVLRCRADLGQWLAAAVRGFPLFDGSRPCLELSGRPAQVQLWRADTPTARRSDPAFPVPGRDGVLRQV